MMQNVPHAVPFQLLPFSVIYRKDIFKSERNQEIQNGENESYTITFSKCPNFAVLFEYQDHCGHFIC